MGRAASSNASTTLIVAGFGGHVGAALAIAADAEITCTKPVLAR